MDFGGSRRPPIGAARRVRHRRTDSLGWLALAAIIGGGSEASLWFALPLAYLVARTLTSLFEAEALRGFYPAPAYARWVTALGFVAALCILTIALQDIGRALVRAPEGLLANATLPPDSVILALVAIVFLGTGYFLFASIWTPAATWRGVGIAVATFGMITSLGAGWSAALPRSGNPLEVWQSTATHPNVRLLRQTLAQITDRRSRGFPQNTPIVALVPQDGVIAWVLRDYQAAHFINTAPEARAAEIVLLPAGADATALVAPYVGQDFVVSRSANQRVAYPGDLIAFWTQRLARQAWSGEDRIVLWVRQDVYDGVQE